MMTYDFRRSPRYITAGLSQHSHSLFRVPRDLLPHFTLTNVEPCKTPCRGKQRQRVRVRLRVRITLLIVVYSQPFRLDTWPLRLMTRDKFCIGTITVIVIM
jgi:hypothetical protein